MDTLEKLVAKAMSDKALFMELLADADGTLKARNIRLSDSEKKLLMGSIGGIRKNIATELTRVKVEAAGHGVSPIADGIIGW